MIRTLKYFSYSLLSLLALGVLAACSSSHNPDSGPGGDTGTDSGVTDSGAFDSSGPSDSSIPDSGVVDSARPDAGACVDPPLGNSRPVAWECSECRPPGSGGFDGAICSDDADCTEGANGRCVGSRMGGICSYDECFADSDCTADQLCACDGGYARSNICVAATCHLDADCGTFDCSPTLGSCGHYFPPVGYYCHTADDACSSDADCGGGYCAYSPETGVWACSTSECAG